jgi:hypothetical protein
VNGIEITAMSKSKPMDTLDCPLMSAITKSFAPPIAAQDIGEQETLLVNMLATAYVGKGIQSAHAWLLLMIGNCEMCKGAPCI